MRARWWHWLAFPLVVPNIVVSLLLALVYRPTHWRFSDGCLELVAGRRKDGSTRIWGRPGAQCLLCPVIWYASEKASNDDALRVHERVHVVQGFLLGGVLAALAYGLHFFWNWAMGGFVAWKTAYYFIWAERWAYHVQDQYEKGARPWAWGAR